MEKPIAGQRNILSTTAAHQLPAGMRAYVIGDVHGRADLLLSLLDAVERDSRDVATKQLIFLGDYIDRGLESKRVIDVLLSNSGNDCTFLLGNHEQVMRRVLTDGDVDLCIDWLRHGGRETFSSYGVALGAHPDAATLANAIAELRAALPAAHQQFLLGLELHKTLGDYFFCHAGVRPGLPLHEQTESDLLWSRSQFIPHTGAYEKMVVHGHTVVDDVDMRENRIGIDTGAYATGRLSALVLEGSSRWLLQTGA